MKQSQNESESNPFNAVNFSITQSNTICIVYVIDSYRPVAGEITLAVTGFKGTFRSLLVYMLSRDCLHD